MQKTDWDTQLRRRHQAPPPAPAGEWQAVLERTQGAPRRRGWILALGGGLATAALLAVFLLPGVRPQPATAEDETLATEQWVQQQWGSTAAGALAEDQAAEPDADLLNLLDKV